MAVAYWDTYTSKRLVITMPAGDEGKCEEIRN